MKNPSETKPLETRKLRKSYVKPQIEQVRLALEEAVLGTGCKSSSSNGPTDPCAVGLNTCLIEGS